MDVVFCEECDGANEKSCNGFYGSVSDDFLFGIFWGGTGTGGTGTVGTRYRNRTVGTGTGLIRN